MSNTITGGGPSDAELEHRHRLANRLVQYSFATLAIALLGFIVIASIAAWKGIIDVATSPLAPFQLALDKVVTAVLPLLGAWVGAIIAFYFGRENYEAAARNVSQAIATTQQELLATTAAQDAMIAANNLEVVKTTSDDGKSLREDLMPRFEDKGLGRIIIVTDDTNTGLGVIHDNDVNRFILERIKAAKATPGDQPANETAVMNEVTLKNLLDDAAMRKLIDAVVYVTPTTTLAEVKRKMEEASTPGGKAVRDAFVTATGSKSEPIVGYISDIDIADRSKPT